MDWFNRFMRTAAAPVSLLFIKIFTAARTGLDTLIVLGMFELNVSTIQFINAVIYVALIDLVFTGLWMYAAYGGESKQASLLRPYAIFGAWVLYVGMIVVGWDAHPESPYLALLARVAGGVALGYDTSNVMGPALRSIYGFFSERIKEHNRAKGPEETYQRVVRDNMVSAIRDASPAMRARIKQAVESRLPELDDVVYGILPTPDSFTDTSRSDADNVPPRLPENVPAGFIFALQDSWNTCKQSLQPNEIFTRTQIEECTSLGRSRATDVINFGIEQQEVRKVGKGRYIFQPIIQGTVVEDRSAESSTEKPPDF